MSKRDEHDVANALLAKTGGDEAGLRALVDHHDVPDHVAGFHAQQAIEKTLRAVLTAQTLRAVLTARDVPFERRLSVCHRRGLPPVGADAHRRILS
jgi:hypothetical protein